MVESVGAAVAVPAFAQPVDLVGQVGTVESSMVPHWFVVVAAVVVAAVVVAAVVVAAVVVAAVVVAAVVLRLVDPVEENPVSARIRRRTAHRYRFSHDRWGSQSLRTPFNRLRSSPALRFVKSAICDGAKGA